MNVEAAIRKIHTHPDGWVRVECIRRVRGGLDLEFAIHEGQKGPKIDSWSVACRGVLDFCIADLDGGGLAVYGNRHWVVRQFTGPQTELRWTSSESGASDLGVLIRSHTQTVYDWIPSDRYLDFSAIIEGRRICRGPDFLLRAYAKALRARGCEVRFKERRSSIVRTFRAKALHFGDSSVVARKFSARRNLLS